METNEIKKLLYKQNPKAELTYIRKGTAHYMTSINVDSDIADTVLKIITFEIPVSDMGDADFTSTMQAKLLIRWILNTETVENY